jgi:hypothetical protein
MDAGRLGGWITAGRLGRSVLRPYIESLGCLVGWNGLHTDARGWADGIRLGVWGAACCAPTWLADLGALGGG